MINVGCIGIQFNVNLIIINFVIVGFNVNVGGVIMFIQFGIILVFIIVNFFGVCIIKFFSWSIDIEVVIILIVKGVVVVVVGFVLILKVEGVMVIMFGVSIICIVFIIKLN